MRNCSCHLNEAAPCSWRSPCFLENFWSVHLHVRCQLCEKTLFLLQKWSQPTSSGACVYVLMRWIGGVRHFIMFFIFFCEGVPVPMGATHAFVRMFLSAAPPGAPLTFPRRLSEDRPSRLASSVCHCHQPEGQMKDRALAGFPTMESCLLRLTYFFNLSFPSFIWNRYIA